MNVDIVRGATRKPGSSKVLEEAIASQDALSGQLFIGYPTIATSEGPHPIDALLVSKDKGIIIFDLIEGPSVCGYQDRQDNSANKIEARLRLHRELMRGREFLIPIHTISFAPDASLPKIASEDRCPIASAENLMQMLSDFEWQSPERHAVVLRRTVYESALSAIEGISTIRKSRTRRTVTRENSRGAKLRDLENSIATLDPRQSKAVIETVEGVQRVRGLAGSGKTIVLALKAAYLHAQHPEWRIAVTFNTRSLKGQFRRLIDKFSIEQTGQEADRDNLRILNAWGAPGGDDRDGIYHEFCRVHDVEYFDFRTAAMRFSKGREFASVCEHAVAQAGENRHVYDAILVDEAQDFSPAFLRLCYDLLNEPGRLVYAYDELQNLSGGSLPSPEEIFGREEDGTCKVRFDNGDDAGSRSDVILEKCYRNSRPVLVTAHALGFGIYRRPPPLEQKPRLGGSHRPRNLQPHGQQAAESDISEGARSQSKTGLVQIFEHSQLWEEIGYRSKDGVLGEGASVTIFRPEDTSPRFLETHSDIDDLVRFLCFDTEEEQADWLIEEIRKNLEDDELRHDDIVVINPDPRTTRKKVSPIRSRLWQMKINSHLAGIDTDPDVFFQPDNASVTFTGIYRAKGNEAGMVYIINAQDCNSAALNLASVRNRIFTAITRSKAWVRVLGVGPGMRGLMYEYEQLKQNNFELRFIYPTREQRERMQIVHRDMTAAEHGRLKNRRKGLNELVEDLKSGAIRPEDLSEDLAELRELLGK